MTRLVDTAIDVALDVLIPRRVHSAKACMFERAARRRKEGAALIHRGRTLVERGEKLLAEAEREETSLLRSR